MGSVEKSTKQNVIKKISCIFEKENNKKNKKIIIFLKKFSNFLTTFFLTLIIFLLFRNVISSEAVTGGDLRFIYNSMYSNYSLFPYAWLPNEGIGLGAFSGSIAWVYLVTSLPVLFFGSFLKQNWNIVVIFGYVIPFLLISFFSIKALFSRLFGRNNFFILSYLLYVANTYILMVLGGGQVLIVLAYALFPLTLLKSIVGTEEILRLLQRSGSFIKIKRTALKYIFITSIIFSFQLLLDPRIAYIVFTVILIFLLLQFFFFIKQNTYNKIIIFLAVFIAPLIIAAFINMFWILPTIVLKENPLENFGPAYTTLTAVKYFSFAKLENSIALLHPYWPENIFGKAYFMKPEFLLLPIFAFLSLLFVIKSKFQLKTQNFKNNLAIEQSSNRIIIFFAILGILGAFLAKGANEPFRNIYLWMFNYIPGFILFRDPTKWYMLVAVSYSVLTPFAIWKVYEFLKSKSKFSIFPASLKLRGASKFQINSKSKIFNLQNLFLILTTLYLILLIRPALTGQLTGIFASHKVPAEYKNLEQFILKDNQFYRTLWFPKTQRFAFYSNVHPMVSADNFFNTYDLISLFEKLQKSDTQNLLQEWSFKYIIVPFDSEGEIFLKDRKYDNKRYLETIRQLKNIKWLTAVDCSIAKLLNCSEEPFGKVAVFEIANSKDHFWTTSKDLSLRYKFISPVEYRIDLQNVRKDDLLVFSESYDLGWVLSVDSKKIDSSQFQNLYNSFILEKEGNYSLKLYYAPQVFVNVGSVISILTLVLVLTALGLGFANKK